MKRAGFALVGVVAVVTGLVAVSAAGVSAANTVTVCHVSGNGAVAAVEVNPKAVAFLLAHGFSLPGDVVPGTNNEFVFGEDCVPVPADSDGDGVVDANDACPQDGDQGDGVYANGCPKTVLAVAYSNDGIAGYSPATDVLIAKLVDDNGDGIVSVGDLVTTNRYPLDFAASAFGTFRNTQHTVTGVLDDTATLIRVFIGPGVVVQFRDDAGIESYREIVSNVSQVGIQDTSNDVDELFIVPGAPSDPDTPVGDTSRDTTADDVFIDGEIF